MYHEEYNALGKKKIFFLHNVIDPSQWTHKIETTLMNQHMNIESTSDVESALIQFRFKAMCLKGYLSNGTRWILHEWSFHMKFMKRAFGEFHKFRMKCPRVKDFVYHMILKSAVLSPSK